MSIVFLSMLLLLLALQSWRAPFPFRQGDYIPHGITAKLEFERIDKEETEKAQILAESSVPYWFRHDSGNLDSLPEELRASLGDIARADSIEKLGDETRRDFGLSNAIPVGLRAEEAAQRFGTDKPDERFRELREAVVGQDMAMAQVRIQALVDDFGKFIEPLNKIGVIDPETVKRLEITPDKRILVMDEDVTEREGRAMLLPNVRLQDQLNDAGVLGIRWEEFPTLTKEIRPAISHWLYRRAQPTLRYDQNATQLAKAEARDSVDVRMKRYLKDDILVNSQTHLKADDLELLRDEYQAAEATIPWTSRLSRMAIVFALLLVLTWLNGFYIVLNEPKIATDVGRLVLYLSAIVFTAFIARLGSFDPLRAEIIPLLTISLLIGVAYNQLLATLTAFTLTLLLTMSTTGRLDHFLVLLATQTAGIIPLRKVSTRTTLIKVSFFSAITFFAVSCGAAVVETQSLQEVWDNTNFLVMSAKGAAMCLVAGYLVAGTLPFVEQAFGVVTDMTLLELSDPSHPLLKDLVRLAPGTHNHSMSVASIAETAAEKIGGNGLLIRVGAYFHDIGKMLKPQYFIENLQEGGVSRHTQLNPAMSTLIIIGHVKDGVDLAEQYNLPQPIIDLIEQHHGTTLVEYFYREATKQVECQPDHRTDAEESSFRYPGPKPQTKEAAVLMVADACESACRTLTEPTPKRIESLVNSIAMRRLLDGQFDECDLKMSDLHIVEESIVKSLIAVYHGRIRYPDARSA
ncbi:MAG: HDIG domain-containing protein [Planctomycetaceae bacterium]|nr:HDIG domain-containing protein [Planctomycetaceae bacterium]